MLNITIICVGKLKEKFYAQAAAEYLKRLTPFCRAELIELPEIRKGESPSKAETEAALLREAAAIENAIPRSSAIIALCIEGAETGSEEFAKTLERYAVSGVSKLCFLIGGSDGLHSSVKDRADVRMSMSRMTFPHHLARVMLLEQLYRGFQIMEGGKYHK